MTPSLLPLADVFARPTVDRWRVLVEKLLKGADFDKRLVTRTADGIAIAPLYTRDDRPFDRHLPGVTARWDIRQIHADLNPATANVAILDDLAGGATSVLLRMAAPGWNGLPYAGPALARTLERVLLDVCPISLVAGEYTPDAAGSLMALWRERGIANEKRLGAFNYDPLGTLAATGALYHPIDRALAIAASLVAETEPTPGVTALAADGSVWHAAGATEAQELAAVLATLVAYLRAAEMAGLAPGRALAKIAITIAVDADQLLGLAKLRAMRRLILRVAEACGAASAAADVKICAVTSTRMMTRRDPWVNILRTTMACATAAMAGADAIMVLPFTWALGRPDAFARRVARNTHHVLIEEAGLGRVADPAGGSFAIERLTGDLAAKAWALFQEIEAGGGMAAAITSGRIQRQIGEAAAARAAAIATGKLELTGTSAYPRLGDDGVTVQPWPAEILSADLNGVCATALVAGRDAEPFERLRDAADAAQVRPKIFLASLGPLAEHASRSTWMRNVLAAGGIEAVSPATELHNSADAGRAFAESGATVACICATDETYGQLGEAVAAILKQAGARHVTLAGRPKDLTAGLAKAGVDSFIFAGADRLALLRTLHAALGLAGPAADGVA